ncbi:hypothetical protein NDU88_000635 [Pleurodeles waltl]|uniref:Uncharacterized protein n=1 Tax=Pleurodeles waltl TaxID=8319 RepID=A0AAV7P1W0_PLEWA|nr:hypothetical protein NDU88_000635 [Pleurodeles waltl]
MERQASSCAVRGTKHFVSVTPGAETCAPQEPESSSFPALHMAGDVVYADIRTPGSASRTSETRAANRRSDSQCPHWHRRTLWISGTLNIIAVLAFVGCGVWVFRSHQKSSAVECKWNNSSAGAQPAPSCPLDWQLHGRKCYYFSAKTDRKNWSTSHEDCSSRSSHLVVIEDKAELLHGFDASTKTVITTDASGKRLGLVLSQIDKNA